MDEILQRILLIISTKNMSNAEFADAIKVKPSNISHIRSARNKPSLEFVKRILHTFPEIRPEWLLFGTGTMTRDFDLFNVNDNLYGRDETKKSEISDAIELTTEESPIIPDNYEEDIYEEEKKPASENLLEDSLKKESEKNEYPGKLSKTGEALNKRINRIVMFYDDKTFSEFVPDE